MANKKKNIFIFIFGMINFWKWQSFCAVEESASVEALKVSENLTEKTNSKLNENNENVVADIRKKKLFSNGSEFIIGASLPKKSGLEKIGSAIENGFNLAFSKCNQAGGLSGKIKITFDVKDDQYNRELTKKNIADLLKQTFLCTGFLGTDSVNALIDFLKNQEAFVLFPFDSAFFDREKFKNNMIFLRPGIEKEIDILISCAQQQGITTISIFHEDSLFGNNGSKKAEEIIKKHGLKLLTKTSYPKNTVNIMKAVKDITKEQPPKAILCISHIYPTYNFIEQLVNAGLTNCVFLGVGELFEIQSVISKDRGKMILSSVMPNPEKSDLEIVKEYRDEMKKQRPLDDLSPLSLEGFVCGKLIIHLIEKLSENPTLDELIKKINSLDEVFGGLKLKINSSDNSLSNAIWLNEAGLSKEWVLVAE